MNNSMIYTERRPVKMHIYATPSVAHFPSVKRARRRENLSWGLTAAQLLVISQIGMNWNAYRENIRYSWENSILSYWENSDIPTPDKLPELGMSTELELGGLDLEVAPIDTRLIIPKLNQNVPIVRASEENLLAQDWNALESQIQEKLQDGVVHHPTTANPGEPGNMVITGHSSYYAWDPGRYKTVFTLLEKLEVGDEFVIYHQQKKHVYRIDEKKIIKATDVDILNQDTPEQVTLLTCWPTGTNYKRLVVVGKPVK